LTVNSVDFTMATSVNTVDPDGGRGWPSPAKEESVVIEATRQGDGTASAYATARKRVEQRVGLLLHWVVFLVVNAGLVAAAGGFAGSGWRLAGWGLGLALHTAYVAADVDGLTDRLVRRELQRAEDRSR
jgi:type IV secretory pathway TrbD component